MNVTCTYTTTTYKHLGITVGVKTKVLKETFVHALLRSLGDVIAIKW